MYAVRRSHSWLEPADSEEPTRVDVAPVFELPAFEDEPTKVDRTPAMPVSPPSVVVAAPRAAIAPTPLSIAPPEATAQWWSSPLVRRMLMAGALLVFVSVCQLVRLVRRPISIDATAAGSTRESSELGVEPSLAPLPLPPPPPTAIPNEALAAVPPNPVEPAPPPPAYEPPPPPAYEPMPPPYEPPPPPPPPEGYAPLDQMPPAS